MLFAANQIYFLSLERKRLTGEIQLLRISKVYIGKKDNGKAREMRPDMPMSPLATVNISVNI